MKLMNGWTSSKNGFCNVGCSDPVGRHRKGSFFKWVLCCKELQSVSSYLSTQAAKILSNKYRIEPMLEKMFLLKLRHQLCLVFSEN